MSDATTPAAARTDVGKRREHNEDAYVVRLPLLAVADGVGGSAKGEVASKLAVDTIVAHAERVSGAPSSTEAVAAMERAVLHANRAVHDAQLTDDSLRGMATTIVAIVVRDGGEVVIGHVGDSRIYAISATGARQLTDDHSVVGELVRTGQLDAAAAAHHPQRNVITRALGPDADVAVDAFVAHVGPGDWLLACSDGLTEHVSDEELVRAVVELASTDPDAALERLIEQANARGGTDNITVAIVQPVPSDVSGELRVEALRAAVATTAQLPHVPSSDAPADASGPLPRVRDVETSGELPALSPLPIDEQPYRDEITPPPSRTVRRALLLVLLVLLAAGSGAFFWSQSYYLTERGDGRVGIDRGVPVAGLSTSYRTSDVLAEDLSASDRDHIVDSHRLLSRSDAVRVLEELPDRTTTGEGGDGALATNP